VKIKCFHINRYTIDGRRVIDIGYVFGKIANIRHKPFDCTFSDLVLTGERKIGWYSEFYFTCGVCKIKETVESEDPHKSSMQVNLAAGTGAINAGQGYSQLDILTAVLNMPNMSNCFYQKLHEKVYDFTNATAWESMTSAAKEEAELAIKEGEVNDDGVPLISVIADGAWSKRSYRSNYNALSGVVS